MSTVVDLDEPVDDSLRVCLVQLLLPEDGDVLPDRAEQPYHGRHLYQSPPFLPLLNIPPSSSIQKYDPNSENRKYVFRQKREFH